LNRRFKFQQPSGPGKGMAKGKAMKPAAGGSYRESLAALIDEQL
jgi:hypothetical protein